MPQQPGFTAQQKDPRELGADLVQALAQLLAHNSRFLDDLHQARPLFVRGDVAATQQVGGLWQVQVERAGQSQADAYWYPVYDAGYTPTVGDDVLLVHTDGRHAAVLVGERTRWTDLYTGGESQLGLTITSTKAVGGSATTPVPSSSTDYVVQLHLTGSTANAVWRALSDTTAFSDIKILFQNAELDVDVDQITNGAWSSSNQTLWFKLQRGVAAGGTDYGYQLRVGGGTRSSPPRTWANIYPFSDDFPGSSLSASWAAHNAMVATVSGSRVSLALSSASSSDMECQTGYGAGYMTTMYGNANTSSGASADCRWGWSGASGAFGGSNYAVVQPASGLTVGTAHWQLLPAAGGATGTVVDSGLAWTSADHRYALARDGTGKAYAWVDGTQFVSVDKFETATNYWGFFIGSTPQYGTFSIDWVKTRPWTSPEPAVTAGSLVPSGALRWEPVCDTSGSCLVDSVGNPVMAQVASST